MESLEGIEDAQFHCPGCGESLFSCLLPTTEESRQHWDFLSENEKRWVESYERRHKAYFAAILKDPSELPELDAQEIRVVLDLPPNGKEPLTLSVDGKVIWLEPPAYESYDRYCDIAEILIQKYGGRLKDFTYTEQSMLYLGGDCIGAFDRIDRARKKVTG